MSAKSEFNDKSKRRKRVAPFSLRLTFEERAKLQAAANGVPLGAYIKAVLFDGDLNKVRRRSTNPTHDDAALGRVLAALGQSRISSNINQLARAVWAWISGKSKAITKENEAEIARATQRDRAEKQETIRKQLAERRNLQRQMKLAREKQNARLQELGRDVARAMELGRVPERQAGTNKKRTRRREPNRSHDRGNDFSPN